MSRTPLSSTRRDRRASPSYDVLFYMPTISPLLARTIDPGVGGAETQVFLLTQALAAQGVRVAVISYELPGGTPRHYGGVDVFTRPPQPDGGSLMRKLRDAGLIWRSLAGIEAPVIVRRLAGVDVAIIGAFARLKRRRFVYSSAAVLDFDPEELFEKRRDSRLFRFGLKLVHRVVVQTEDQVAMCERTFGQRPTLIKSIAEVTADGPQLVGDRHPGDRGAFLWVGRVCAQKRPLEFVELARAVPEARFEMVATPPAGRAPDPDHRLWKDLQAEVDETENLELLAPMRRETLRQLIRRSVAIVNTADSEGMPNVFLEGWVEGVPALALRHDPGGVIIRQRLGEFAQGSKQRLAETARRMWRDGAYRARLAAYCRDYVSREHSPATIAAQWASLLTEETRQELEPTLCLANDSATTISQ